MTSFGRKISDKILGDLITSDKYDYKTKLSMIEQAANFKSSIITAEIVNSILFEDRESSNLSPEDKLNYFLVFAFYS